MNRQIIIRNLPSDPRVFEPPFEEEYALLIVVASRVVPKQTRDEITLAVVQSNCQYALCFGYECELWHDLIDESCFCDGVPADRFLMTTWHHEETVEEVIDFFWNHTCYEDFQSCRLAVMIIGEDTVVEREIRTRLNSLKGDSS